ncbi:hypothetical protein AB192_18990 [Aliivibrio fischeri]|nr:hypothetical protein AB192_18990 [Aliivibrio fischeri]
MKSFMKNYRAYSRLGRRIRPTLDEHCIRQYGAKQAFYFEKMAVLENTLTSFNVHKRMALRVNANAQSLSRQNQLRLEKMWRYWSV